MAGALTHLRSPMELKLDRNPGRLRLAPRLEPGACALKYHARGIGFLLETQPVEGKPLQPGDCTFEARCAALTAP